MFLMVWKVWVDDDDAHNGYTPYQMLVAASSAWFIWMLGAATVLYLGGNRHTFYSPLTARGFIEETFKVGSDATKAKQGFGVHKNLITPQLKVDTQAWIDNGWKEWMRERPYWFTEGFRRKFTYYGLTTPDGDEEEDSDEDEFEDSGAGESEAPLTDSFAAEDSSSFRSRRRTVSVRKKTQSYAVRKKTFVNTVKHDIAVLKDEMENRKLNSRQLFRQRTLSHTS
jgi:hypothetical protein